MKRAAAKNINSLLCLHKNETHPVGIFYLYVSSFNVAAAFVKLLQQQHEHHHQPSKYWEIQPT